MPMEIRIVENTTLAARLVVVGVGGGGSNAVNNMIEAGIEGVAFIAANTDIQALERSNAPVHLQLGREVSKGLGAGNDPEVGRSAALEERERIKELLAGSDMVFITAGMGGGTGTGAAPIVADVAKEVGALTVAVVTTPFEFEGRPRMANALAGVEELKKVVDTLIIIPNTRLRTVAQKKETFLDMLKKADSVLRDAVRGVSDLIVKHGLINLDFADVRKVMSEMGLAMMGTGQASGENRSMRAVEEAIKNPLLNEVSISGARSVLFNITAPLDISMDELDDASNHVRELVDENAEIIWGCVIDENIGQEVRVTIIATGISQQLQEFGLRPPKAVNGPQLPLGQGGIDILNPDIGMTGPIVGPYIRKKSSDKGNGLQAARNNAQVRENLDTPTYMRRQAD